MSYRIYWYVQWLWSFVLFRVDCFLKVGYFRVSLMTLFIMLEYIDSLIKWGSFKNWFLLFLIPKTKFHRLIISKSMILIDKLAQENIVIGPKLNKITSPTAKKFLDIDIPAPQREKIKIFISSNSSRISAQTIMDLDNSATPGSINKFFDCLKKNNQNPFNQPPSIMESSFEKLLLYSDSDWWQWYCLCIWLKKIYNWKGENILSLWQSRGLIK